MSDPRAGGREAGLERGADEWKRLEPASLAINLVPNLWRTLRSTWPLLLALVLGGGVQIGRDVLVVLLFLLVSLARTAVHFLTLRYRMAAEKLEIRSGLFGRQNRVIDPAHIQNIELLQNPLHRLFGLVELRLETAGEGGAEGLLSAISASEAKALQTALRRRRARPSVDDADDRGEELERNGVIEVLGHGVAEARAGAALIVYGVAQEIAREFWPEALAETLERDGAGAVLLAVFLSLGYVWSVGGALVRYHGFRLLRSQDGLRTESGLLTRRRVHIPAGRVQLLRLDESVLRRVMGYATVHIETAGANGAGGDPDDGQSTSSEAIIPMVAQELLPETLDAVLPGVAESDRLPWLPSAPLAFIPAVIRGVLRWTLFLWLGGHFLLPAIGLGRMDELAGIGTLFGAWTGWRDWGTAGWKLSSELLVVRRGFLSRQTTLLPRRKVQSVHIVQGPTQRVFGLWSVQVWVAGARLETPELTEEEAARVFARMGGGGRSEA